MSGAYPSAPPPSYEQAAGGFTNPQFHSEAEPHDKNQLGQGSGNTPPPPAVYNESGPGYPPPNMSQPYNQSGPPYPQPYAQSGPAYPPPQQNIQTGPAYPPPQQNTQTGPGYPPPQPYTKSGPAYPPPQQNTQRYPPPQTGLTAPPPQDDISDSNFNMQSFSDKAVRRSFIKKVYLILMSQLLVTIVFICVFMFVEPLTEWIQREGTWFYYVSYGTFLVTYIVLVCIPSVRRKTPGNYICLAVFTLAFSYMTGTIASYYTTNSVLIAAGVTALVCLSISLFAIQTKIDFTMCYGLLFVLVMVLFFFGWACLIVYMTAGYSRILDAVWGGLAALVFGLFLVYDTQMIVGGRKIELSPEEYIYGALKLYIDVVYLFLIFLSLFGKSS